MNSSIFHSQPDGDKGTHEVQSTTSKLLRGTDAAPPPQYVEAQLGKKSDTQIVAQMNV